jgi:hypothetical protein
MQARSTQRTASGRGCRVSWVLSGCLLACSSAGVPPITVPSPGFPSLAAACDAIRGRGGAGELVLCDGMHSLGPAPLVLKRPVSIRAGGPSTVEGAPRGDFAVRLRGSLDMDGEKQQRDTGTFEDILIENQRSREKPNASVCCMEIVGGRWEMVRCQVAGAGTGCMYGALVELGGEPEASTPDRPHSFRSCNSPVLMLRQCCVRNLSPEEIEGDPQHQGVEHLIFAGGNSTLTMEDTNLHGGLWYSVHMFDRASVRMLRCAITGANTAMAVEDMTSLDMRWCTVRENDQVFHVFSPHPRCCFIGNTFIGKLFEDMDRFTNESLTEGE